MSVLSINFRLEMLSNFHIGTGLGDAGRVDRITLRNNNKEVMIPGSTLKGRVRYHCEQLADAFALDACSSSAMNRQICRTENCCLICRLFGSEWHPGGLRFSDARLRQPLRDVVYSQHPDRGDAAPLDFQTQPRTRTRINRRVRRVEEGALFTLEEGAAGLEFEGKIVGNVQAVEGSDAPVPLELLALLGGTRLLTHLGGKKTGGLGSCALSLTKVEPIPPDAIELAKPELEESAKKESDELLVSLQIHPQRVLERSISNLLNKHLVELEYYDLYRNA
jgi:CRISPR/Cas system CSM-associated protein Csm3 (group 7 of RAMP superfamily)